MIVEPTNRQNVGLQNQMTVIGNWPLFGGFTIYYGKLFEISDRYREVGDCSGFTSHIQ